MSRTIRDTPEYRRRMMICAAGMFLMIVLISFNSNLEMTSLSLAISFFSIVSLSAILPVLAALNNDKIPRYTYILFGLCMVFSIIFLGGLVFYEHLQEPILNQLYSQFRSDIIAIFFTSFSLFGILFYSGYLFAPLEH